MKSWNGAISKDMCLEWFLKLNQYHHSFKIEFKKSWAFIHSTRCHSFYIKIKHNHKNSIVRYLIEEEVCGVDSCFVQLGSRLVTNRRRHFKSTSSWFEDDILKSQAAGLKTTFIILYCRCLRCTNPKLPRKVQKRSLTSVQPLPPTVIDQQGVNFFMNFTYLLIF